MNGLVGLLPKGGRPLRRPLGRSELGLASIESWPAAGGGLLVGMAEPAFAGVALLRAPIKTVFLQLSSGGAITLLLPYVGLEQEVRRCAQALVADELSVAPDTIIVSDGRTDGRFAIVDLARRVERNLQACAATARELLRAAAAEVWSVPACDCRISGGSVTGPMRDQRLSCWEVVVDAALADRPAFVRLRSGRLVCVRPRPGCPRSRRPNPRDPQRSQDGSCTVLCVAPTV